MTDTNIVIKFFGGNCPVQGEGTINGKPFYFRARGDSWSLGIGGDPVGNPEWEHQEWYGTWPDAGWMEPEQAEAFLMAAAARFAQGLPGAKLATTDRIKPKTPWAEGFSREELLRRAEIFLELACDPNRTPEQRRVDARLAREHEDAAND